MATDEMPQPTRWIVWGDGDPAPERFFDEEIPGDADLEEIRARDPAWRTAGEGWAVVVSATELELEDFRRANDSVRGFTPQPPRSGPHAKVETPRPY
jgi:hypothetical protein